MRNNELNNARGRPVAAYDRTNEPIVRHNGFNNVRRPLQNNGNINNINNNKLPECGHCLLGGHRKEQCYRFKNGLPATTPVEANARKGYYCRHC